MIPFVFDQVALTKWQPSSPCPVHFFGVKVHVCRFPSRNRNTRIGFPSTTCSATRLKPSRENSPARRPPNFVIRSPSRSPLAKAGDSGWHEFTLRKGSSKESSALLSVGAGRGAEACSECSPASISFINVARSVLRIACRLRRVVIRMTSMSFRGYPSLSTRFPFMPTAGAPSGPGDCSSSAIPRISASIASFLWMRERSCSCVIAILGLKIESFNPIAVPNKQILND